jgi:hypothetical protein
VSKFKRDFCNKKSRNFFKTTHTIIWNSILEIQVHHDSKILRFMSMILLNKHLKSEWSPGEAMARQWSYWFFRAGPRKHCSTHWRPPARSLRRRLSAKTNLHRGLSQWCGDRNLKQNKLLSKVRKPLAIVTTKVSLYEMTYRVFSGFPRLWWWDGGGWRASGNQNWN